MRKKKKGIRAGIYESDREFHEQYTADLRMHWPDDPSVSTTSYAAFAGRCATYLLGIDGVGSRVNHPRMKFKLPGINGNMSVKLPGHVQRHGVNLSAAEVVLITCAQTVLQCWPHNNTKLKQQQGVNLGGRHGHSDLCWHMRIGSRVLRLRYTES